VSKKFVDQGLGRPPSAFSPPIGSRNNGSSTTKPKQPRYRPRSASRARMSGSPGEGVGAFDPEDQAQQMVRPTAPIRSWTEMILSCMNHQEDRQTSRTSRVGTPGTFATVDRAKENGTAAAMSNRRRGRWHAAAETHLAWPPAPSSVPATPRSPHAWSRKRVFGLWEYLASDRAIDTGVLSSTQPCLGRAGQDYLATDTS